MTFTFLCHGTGSHRSGTYGVDQRDEFIEIITTLGRYISGVELSEMDQHPTEVQQRQHSSSASWFHAPHPSHWCMILDGPGADELDNENQDHSFPFFTHGRAGTFSAGGEKKSSNVPWKKTGTALGRGWNENVTYALQMLNEHFFNKNPDNNLGTIKNFNLIGWSRGAVTCIKLARNFYQHGYLKHIPVNMFLVDPVAGPGNWSTDDNRHLEPNVHNYMALLSETVDKPLFGAQDASTVHPMHMEARDNPLHFIYLLFPGGHNTPAKKRIGFNKSSAKPNTLAEMTIYHQELKTNLPLAQDKDVGDIAFFLAKQFLTYHGTIFIPELNKIIPDITEDELLNKYSHMCVNRHLYNQWDNRNLDKNLYVMFPDYFVNEHHRLLFMNKMPKLYDHYFKQRKTLTAFQKEHEHLFREIAFDVWANDDLIPSDDGDFVAIEKKEHGYNDVWNSLVKHEEYYKASFGAQPGDQRPLPKGNPMLQCRRFLPPTSS